MNTHGDYIELLKIYMQVVEANKDVVSVGDERILDAEGLAIKFFGHTISLYYLYKGISVRDQGLAICDFVDPSSINVVGRAAIETFLTFHYVFVEPQTDEDKDLRYISWELAGLIERQGFPARSPAGKKRLEDDKQLIETLRNKLKKNSVFDTLSNRQKRRLIERGEWRLKSWREIILSAGLSKIHAESFYSYLCGYAHSGNLSILQVRQTRTNQERRALIESTFSLMMIAMANIIKAYCAIFPKAKAMYTKVFPSKNVVDLWFEVGARSDEDIDINWDEFQI